jgi:TolA-binding protein
LTAQTPKNRTEVYKAEELKQGELLFQKASEFYEDRNYSKTIEEVKLFLILYLRHPREWEARKLLSKSYRRMGDTLALAQNELHMYKDYPNTEEGLDAYLEAARALIRLGREAKATTILKDITQNTYSSKIAQEAELELAQLEILGESKNK